MATLEETVRERLGRIAYPGFKRDIVSLGVVDEIRVQGSRVDVRLDLGAGHPGVGNPLRKAVEGALLELSGVEETHVHLRESAAGASDSLRVVGQKSEPPSVARAGSLDRSLIPEVRRVVAIASGKGGVGKSTVAVHLAVALARSGWRVGLLDADIYGPSIPLMTGIVDPPRQTPDRKLVPFERFGLRVMSLGFLVEAEQAVIWRGPMVMKAIEQLLGDVAWGALDLLVVDMPPGTGDAQLTLSQRVGLSGAVIVTTPQDVALADARKGVAMFRKVDVPILGIVENMSYFSCPGCQERSEIFGHGGGRREAERLGVPFLGELPLDPHVRRAADSGNPVVVGDDPSGKPFHAIAAAIRESLEANDPPSDGDEGSVFGRFRRLFDR